MKVARCAARRTRLPERGGDAERIVSCLTEELVRLGHDVMLFASERFQTAATLVPCCPRGLRFDRSSSESMAYHFAMIEQVSRRRHEFDVLHFHLDYLHFPLFRSMAHHTLTTLHGPLDRAERHAVHCAFLEMALVSSSDNQRWPMPPVRWIGTVHHGPPADRLVPPGKPEPRDYLVFLGRISPDKRVDRAIDIATKAKLRLKIAGKIHTRNAGYFQNCIRPLLEHSSGEFVGEVGAVEKAALLGGARALLFLADGPEPPGLSMMEAMACGTPVIAWACGSAPEIVEEGSTGFIVHTIEAAVQAVIRSGQLIRLLFGGVSRPASVRHEWQRATCSFIAPFSIHLAARSVASMRRTAQSPVFCRDPRQKSRTSGHQISRYGLTRGNPTRCCRRLRQDGLPSPALVPLRQEVGRTDAPEGLGAGQDVRHCQIHLGGQAVFDDRNVQEERRGRPACGNWR